MATLPNPAQELMRQIDTIPVVNDAFAIWLKLLDKSSEDVISISFQHEAQQIPNDGLLWIKKTLTGYTTVTLAFSDLSSSVQVFDMNWKPQLPIIGVYNWKI